MTWPRNSSTHSRPASPVPRAGGSGAARSWCWRRPSEVRRAPLRLSHQALRTCANPSLKGFMCLKQETSENHSNMDVLSASTHRELKLGHEAAKAPSCWKNHPSFFPRLRSGDLATEAMYQGNRRLVRHLAALTRGRQPSGKLAAVPPSRAATAVDRSPLSLTSAEPTHSISSDQRYLQLMF